VSSYVSFSNDLNTNKAGVSDLKHGRKKIAIEHLVGMKKSYPEINLDYIITGIGSIEESFDKGKIYDKDDYVVELQRKHIDKLEEEIERLKKANESKKGYLHAAEPE
jgi:hypothetical protein